MSLRAKRVLEKATNSFQSEYDTERVSNSLKVLFRNDLRELEKESIVTKRVAPGEVDEELLGPVKEVIITDIKPVIESGVPGARAGAAVIANSITFGLDPEVNGQANEAWLSAQAQGDILTQIGFGAGIVGAEATIALLVPTGIPRGTPRGEVAEVAISARNFLDDGYEVLTNKSGDTILMSKDGLRKIRFDFKNTGGDLPHVHIEILIRGRWHDAIPGRHRIYPKP